MSVTWTANLDPKIIALVDTAFDKSWQFVRTDPELAHRDVREMRASLTESLTRLARNGEREFGGSPTARSGNCGVNAARLECVRTQTRFHFC